MAYLLTLLLLYQFTFYFSLVHTHSLSYWRTRLFTHSLTYSLTDTQSLICFLFTTFTPLLYRFTSFSSTCSLLPLLILSLSLSLSHTHTLPSLNHSPIFSHQPFRITQFFSSPNSLLPWNHFCSLGSRFTKLKAKCGTNYGFFSFQTFIILQIYLI